MFSLCLFRYVLVASSLMFQMGGSKSFLILSVSVMKLSLFVRVFHNFFFDYFLCVVS